MSSSVFMVTINTINTDAITGARYLLFYSYSAIMVYYLRLTIGQSIKPIKYLSLNYVQLQNSYLRVQKK